MKGRLQKTRSEKSSRLVQGLAMLEERLLGIVLPGEFQQWLDTLVEALETLAPRLQEQLASANAEVYEKLSLEAPHYSNRFEELRSADQMWLEEFRQFRERVLRVYPFAEQLERNAVELRETVNSIVDQGLALVMHCKRHEAAVQGWVFEALNRDEGQGD